MSVRLRERGFQVFLPVVPREEQWHDRKRVVEWPLFPGYLFVRLPARAMSEALATAGVVTVVRQNGAPAPIRDEVIAGVNRLAAVVAETGEVPQPTPMIRRGQRVRITAGPLEGVQGVVAERRSGDRTLVQIGVQAIGQGVKVEVDTRQLHILEEVV